jgi:hypothetical protein
LSSEESVGSAQRRLDLRSNLAHILELFERVVFLAQSVPRL